MTDATAEVWQPSAAPSAPALVRGPWVTRAELRDALVVVAVLAVVGALLGLLWQWWSPPGPLAGVLPGHRIQPDETEAWVAADGRYAVITAVTGLLAGVGLWFRRELRGPVGAAALGVGGLVGGLLTEYVGRAVDGGKSNGAVNTLIAHLRLDLHMHGLRVLEPLVALLAYSLIVAFAPTDDLGVDGPTEQSFAVESNFDALPPSVQADGHAQHGGGYGDAAGALQQPQFPPQQRHGQV